MTNREDISARVSAGIAQALKHGEQLRTGVEDNVEALVQAQLAKLDLVTREEFAAQQALLRQAEARLAALEEEVARLKDQA